MKGIPMRVFLIPHFFLILFLATLLMLPVSHVHADPNIPDTGQTKCYDALVNELNPCPAPSQPFYGQDAQYQPQHPRSYTKLGLNDVELGDDALPADQDGPWLMTRDNVTGLIWEIKQNKDGTVNYGNPHDADNTYTWYDSNPETNCGVPGTLGDGITSFDTEQFINALNSHNYGGFNDWRMPTIKELASLVNRDVWDPIIDAGRFPGTQSDVYWSSTTETYDTGNVWYVFFFDGRHDSTGSSKASSLYVRAVRDGQSGLFDDSIISGRMVDNGDDTVTDTAVGLMWQQTTAPGKYSWQNALSYAEGSEIAGYHDWRLPNINELKTLVDFTRDDPAIDPIAFLGTASWYWSSTTLAINTHSAWMVFLSHGNATYTGKIDSNSVRAVRGGQTGSLGHLVMLSPKQASIWNIGNLMPIRWNTDGLEATVKISLSRQGGKEGSFETIISSTSNDGHYDWNITAPISVNCVIKIEQANNPAIWATKGLFIITSVYPDINQPPVAKATADKTSAAPGEQVTLDGSGSSAPDSTIVSYVWTQIDTTGVSVDLSTPNAVKASFTAPEVADEDAINLIFELKVTDDNNTSATHTVRIAVRKSSGGGGSGGGCFISCSKKSTPKRR